jgi:rubrerythrin
MPRSEDIEIMIQALAMTIAVHEREEAFFRRSAAISTSEEAKALFEEIADDARNHVSSLSNRKNKLTDQLAVLKDRTDPRD